MPARTKAHGCVPHAIMITAVVVMWLLSLPQVDLAADRLQMRADHSAQLTRVRRELGEVVEQSEIRSKEELTGCESAALWLC
jgi:hypothetical protein